MAVYKYFFESAIFAASENDSTLTYTLIRTGGSSGVISVDLAFENGSAQLGNDYNVISQSDTIIFQDGETSVSGTISIIDDSIVEFEESLIIRLSNPQGGAILGVIGDAAVTIADNDESTPDGSSINDSALTSDSTTSGGGSLNLLFLIGLLCVPIVRARKLH